MVWHLHHNRPTSIAAISASVPNFGGMYLSDLPLFLIVSDNWKTYLVYKLCPRLDGYVFFAKSIKYCKLESCFGL